jgi:hypothetical protein
MENPFGAEPSRPDVVRFVSILSKPSCGKTSLPIAVPGDGEWFVRIIGSTNRLVFGVYRRHMKTIGYLGQIDELFGAPATTRSWNTILSVLRILKTYEPATNGMSPADGLLRDGHDDLLRQRATAGRSRGTIVGLFPGSALYKASHAARSLPGKLIALLRIEKVNGRPVPHCGGQCAERKLSFEFGPHLLDGCRRRLRSGNTKTC